MKLYWKIVLLTLLPLLLTAGAGFFQIEGMRRIEDGSREKAKNLKVALLHSRFRAFREEREKYATLLAGNRDAARAVKIGDTGFLLSWSQLFLDPLRLSRILFTDMEGTVLARAHILYRFGDNLGSHPIVASALGGESSSGIFSLGGELLILHSLPVKLYGEIQVGTVVVGTELTSEYLAALAEGAVEGMELKIEGVPALSTGNCDGERYAISLPFSVSEGTLKIENITVYFSKDPLASGLFFFQRNLALALVILSIFLASGVFFLLRRYLCPFFFLARDVTLLSEEPENFSKLQKKLSLDFKKYKKHEILVIVGALSGLMERVQKTILLLEWSSRMDPLTRISNRLHLDSILKNETLSAQHTEEPLSVVIFDLDHFKQVNDEFGHQMGDKVLRRTAEILKLLVPVGFVGRWGGEEFLAVLPGATALEALDFGERTRKAMEREPFPISRSVTMSAGVTEMVSGDTPDSLVARADKALYEAKGAGRNRVVLRKA